MNLAKRFAIPATALALTLVAVAPALAQLAPESAQYYGKLRIDLVTNNSTWAPGPITDATGDVYNNTNPPSPPNFGFASTDLASQFGDRVSTTGTGLLSQNDFTVYNDGSSAGPLLTANYVIRFLDGTTNALLGAYGVTLNFTGGGGLPPGFFAIVSVSNLIPANINLNTQDVLVVQQMTSMTGTATSIGIASLDPPSIGSSASSMYINSSTVGPAGYYLVGSPPLNANPGYRLNVTTTVDVKPGTWGHVKALYH